MTTMAVIGITGATDGIGRATAQVLLAEGHRVLVHARSRERGEPILQALGGDGALLVGDLARLDDVHWLTKSASTARSTRGCTMRVSGYGAARRAPRRTVTK